MSKEIIFFTRFVLNEDNGGGCRREVQLMEALKPFDPILQSFRESKWNIPKNYNSIPQSMKLAHWLEPSRKYWGKSYKETALRMTATSMDWIKLVKKKNPRAVFIDDPLFFVPLIRYLCRKKIPIIALCQNIESLSYSQIRSGIQQKIFQHEIALLKKCRLAVTISWEDTYVLKNFNIPVHYFPYYPTKSIEHRMLSIRKKRECSRKKNFLMIGTASNPVTCHGMKTFIDYWKSRNQSDEKLIVAGFWTEMYLKTEQTENIHFIGEVSNHDLDSILAGIKAMICYQEYGSGALTKIGEMIIAGVPILANPLAARSYYKYQNVLEFSDLNRFEETRGKLDNTSIPLSPNLEKPDIKELHSKISSLLKQTS